MLDSILPSSSKPILPPLATASYRTHRFKQYPSAIASNPQWSSDIYLIFMRGLLPICLPLIVPAAESCFILAHGRAILSFGRVDPQPHAVIPLRQTELFC